MHELLDVAFGHLFWAAFLTESVLAGAGVGAVPSRALPQLTGRAIQLGCGQMAAPAVSGLMRSPMRLSSLEQAAGPANPQGHFLVAAFCRCGRSNPCHHEESLKGRVLTAIEHGWVEDCLRLEPQHRRYEALLEAAALRGVRAAAPEYGTAFEDPEFIALAERLTGEVDALMMARLASIAASRERWLRTAAEHRSRRRCKHARPKATPGPKLALEHGVDLTRSTMAAYHDGGERDGQFYDSDFGGPRPSARFSGNGWLAQGVVIAPDPIRLQDELVGMSRWPFAHRWTGDGPEMISS